MFERTKHIIARASLAAGVMAMAAGGAWAQSAPPSYVLPDPATLPQPSAEMIAAAIPMERLVEPGATYTGEPVRQSTGTPAIAAGETGRALRGALAEDFSDYADAAANDSIAPQNYGSDSLDTFFHYNDYRQDATWAYPYRTVGRLFFTFDGSSWYTCTATLIGRAHIVTAGHCVHEGGNGAAGWITQAYFAPAYSSSSAITNQRFGRCDIQYVTTTTGWYNDGNILQGYDVGVAVCGRIYQARVGRFNNTAPGFRLGYMGFCYNNCTMGYHFLTQLGYPGNYYSGGEMTTSQHVETTAVAGPLGYLGPDYHYGTGMRGGSSGGPHISNIGTISDSSSDPGQLTARNIVYAVTSWGYNGEAYKLQGSSPLSGPSNSNNFTGLYNAACTYARSYYGRYICSPI